MSFITCTVTRMIKSRRMGWAGHVECTGEKRNSYTVLVGKPEGKRPLGRRRCRWEDNTEIDLKRHRMGLYGLNSSGSGQEPAQGPSKYGSEQ
jgi:hypothetical protein